MGKKITDFRSTHRKYGGLLGASAETLEHAVPVAELFRQIPATCQRRFPLRKAIPLLTPLQRGILIKIEASPGGATCADLYPLMPFAKRPARALKVHIS